MIHWMYEINTEVLKLSVVVKANTRDEADAKLNEVLNRRGRGLTLHSSMSSHVRLEVAPNAILSLLGSDGAFLDEATVQRIVARRRLALRFGALIAPLNSFWDDKNEWFRPDLLAKHLDTNWLGLTEPVRSRILLDAVLAKYGSLAEATVRELLPCAEPPPAQVLVVQPGPVRTTNVEPPINPPEER